MHLKLRGIAKKGTANTLQKYSISLDSFFPLLSAKPREQK